MIDPGLEGKVVVITGANSGIGSGVARAFAAQGAIVAIHYLAAQPPPAEPGIHFEHATPGEPAARELAETLRAAGARVVLVSGDLADAGSVPVLFSQVEESAGPVEILVNNAAHCESPDTLQGVSAEGIDRHFRVNARAPVLLMQEFVRRHIARGASWGRIINISTDSARTFPTQIAYGASKFALEGFTRSIAVELGGLGITVNAVAPGPVQTGWMTEAIVKAVLPSIPLGRVGRPEDIADAVVFLASAQAGWVTGQVLQVAGGHAL